MDAVGLKIMFDQPPLRAKLLDLLTPSSLIFQWKNKLVVIWGKWIMYTFTLALECGQFIFEPQCIHVFKSGYWKITVREDF